MPYGMLRREGVRGYERESQRELGSELNRQNLFIGSSK